MTDIQRYYVNCDGFQTADERGPFVLASDAEAAIAAAELAAYQVGHEAAAAGSLTHACPPSGSGIMPCCGRTPFDVPRYDRMTLEPSRVTCNAYEQGQRDALDAAVTRVEALPATGRAYDFQGMHETLRRAAVIAAIKDGAE